MEYRLTITIPAHGMLEENAELLLDAFLRVHPEVGPVVSGNLMDSTLSVTFSLEASDLDTAFQRGQAILAEGVSASRLTVRAGAVKASVEALEESELEPVPATLGPA